MGGNCVSVLVLHSKLNEELKRLVIEGLWSGLEGVEKDCEMNMRKFMKEG